MPQRVPFAQQIEAEIAAANGNTCGVVISNGAGFVCLRKPHDSSMVHVGHQADGSLVQWADPIQADPSPGGV